MNMSEQIKRNSFLPAVLVYLALPLIFYALGDFPRRTVIKESLSILTILAFCMVLFQFFLARNNKKIFYGQKMGQAIKFHKALGYIFVFTLLVHPFFIVLPRYFESGVDPMEAFITIITSFDSIGIVLGMVAWCLMLVLGVTSLVRKKLPLNYKTWRIFHGTLSVIFVLFASWHAIELGRHTDWPISAYIVIVAAGGVLLLLSTYVFDYTKERG